MSNIDKPPLTHHLHNTVNREVKKCKRISWLAVTLSSDEQACKPRSSRRSRSNHRATMSRRTGNTRAVARFASVYLHDQHCVALFTRDSMISHHNSKLNWIEDRPP